MESYVVPSAGLNIFCQLVQQDTLPLYVLVVLSAPVHFLCTLAGDYMMGFKVRIEKGHYLHDVIPMNL